MSNFSRREFLGLSALLAGGRLEAQIQTARAPSVQTSSAPDLVLVNGRVFTSDPAIPRAEAFAVKNGRFVAVGSTRDIRNLVTRNTTVLDGAGMFIFAGFIDTHCHPSGVNELYGVNTDLRTIREIKEALRKKAAATPPGYWITGFKFDDTKLEEGRALTRKDLDEVSKDHPVAVAHRGGHTTWYNSKAFELAGITKNTPDPSDGRFFRDAAGELQGQVAERARNVFNRVGKREEFTPEQLRQRAQSGMKYMSGLLTAAGLTTVHDAGADAVKVRAYEDCYNAGELKHRAYMMIRGPYEQFRDGGVYTGFGNEWVRVGGVKYVADGSASERTMRMSTPYVGKPNDFGILTMTQQEIHDAVEDAHRHNWQVGIHANGDVTIDMVLKAYERVLEKWPHPDRRHRVEHCSLVNPEIIRRLKISGTIPTPFWTYAHYHGEKWKEYGDEKMQWMFCHRSFLEAGIRVPGASDYTPGPFEPLMAIQSMVTRKDYSGHVWGPNQRITVDQALTVATINGAYASFEEKVKGSITPGKYADFVILEKDPHDVDPDQIKNIKIVRTVVGGAMVFSS